MDCLPGATRWLSQLWTDLGKVQQGFGTGEGEFWLSNEIIHKLTDPSSAPHKSQLLINMRGGQNIKTGISATNPT